MDAGSDSAGLAQSVVRSAHTSDRTAINRGRAARRRLLTGETIVGRVIPSFIFQFLVIGKALDLAHRLKEGSSFASPLALVSFTVQQSAGIALMAFCVVLFVVRRPSVGRRSSPTGALLAIAGTFVMSVPIGARVVEDCPVLLLTSSALVLAGLGWVVASLAVLGRSFGLFPEARGLVTRGPYRLVRHPVYLGEIVASLGLVIATASPAMFGVFVALCALQYGRSLLEERALLEAFPAYADYQRWTYRLVPGLL